MKTLGIQVHHNSSACLFDDGNLIYYNQEERLSKIKNHEGIPWNCLSEIKKIIKEIDNVVITGYNYDSDFCRCIYDLITNHLGFVICDGWISFFKPHHLSHAYKSFLSSNFEESLVFVWDGRGSNFILSDGTTAYETTTVYHMSHSEGIKILYKKLYRDFPGDNLEGKTVDLLYTEDSFNNVEVIGENTDIVVEVLTDGYDIGQFYESSTWYFGFNPTECGKLMGLHSYGKKNTEISKILYDDRKFKINLRDESQVKRYNFSNNLLDLSYETQKGLEYIQLNLINEILNKNISKNIVLTGGVSLNIVANSSIRKNIPKDINLYVEPLCGDEGNCLGITQYYINRKTNLIPKLPNTMYLCGKNPSYNCELIKNEQIFHDVNYSFICELLIKGNIVAIFQGKTESGPRALGNRSILLDPRIKNGKDIVNRVKKREPFRPFACSILLEESHKWFDMSLVDESPHMMYSFDALPGVKEIIPSVVHVDNTCRIQTVTKTQNYHFYNLIEEFYKQTSVPILFNTSFNLAGDPIVETLEDAIRTLKNSELQYLYLPEISKVIFIPNISND